MKTESRKFGRIGQLLPVKDAQSRGDGTQTRDNDRWESIVEQGLRKTYRQGRRRMRQVVANAETSDDEWHELRKRVKDLGYQVTLLKKVKGIKPLLKKLDDVGTALGDARDLTLLRDSLKCSEKMSSHLLLIGLSAATDTSKNEAKNCTDTR
jgi:CHAD domain-containing protein